MECYQKLKHQRSKSKGVEMTMLSSTSCVAENFSYGFKKVGQDPDKILKSKDVAENSGLVKLIKAFEEWLDSVPAYIGENGIDGPYKKAVRNISFVQNNTLSLDDIPAILVSQINNPRLNKNAGIFISAMINAVPDNEILLTEEMLLSDSPNSALNYVGYGLAKNKILVNKTILGDYACNYSKGKVINYHSMGSMAAAHSTGLSLNYWNTKSFFGYRSKHVIDCGYAEGQMGNFCSGLVLDLNIPNRAHDVEAGRCSSKSAVVLSSYQNYFKAQKKYDRLLLLKYPDKTGRILRLALPEKQCFVPELFEYYNSLRELFEQGKDNYKNAIAAMNSLDPDPAITVNGKVQEILGRHQPPYYAKYRPNKKHQRK